MKRLYAVALLLVTCSRAYNQPNFGYLDKVDTLFSVILNEKRPVYIYLPEGYDKESIRYPVIYMLDADTRCAHGVPTARFIADEGFMPKSIIIGIPNVNRNRDLLPGFYKSPPTGDGAGNFLQFITNELFTYVEKHYRADSYRVLIGHSFGGLFAMHSMLTNPDAFEGYIMIDPSFWYGSEMMVNKASDFFKTHPSFPKAVYISGNVGESWKEMSNDAMDSVFKATAPKDLQWKSVAYENESHSSVTFKTIYDGLRFVFNDFRTDIGMLIPDKGMIVENRPYYVTMQTDLKMLFYTTDGTMPSRMSSVLRPDSNNLIMLPIDKAYTVNISSASKYEGSKVLTGRYEYALPLEPVKLTGKLKNGLRYRLYQGNWNQLPDFSTLQPCSTGTVNNFTMPDSSKLDYFGIQFEGYIFIAEEGYYDMAINSDDGSRLSVDNKPILDNDGLHGADEFLVYRLYLKKGYHSINVDYFEKTGGEALRLEMMKYPWIDRPDMKIPDDLLFYRVN